MVAHNVKGVPKDSSRINLADEHEVRFWCGRFGRSRAELEQAVKVAGPSSTAVQAYLARNVPKQ